MTQLPFDNFDCDHCGACCKSLIVEAHDYDARREPRLYQIGNVDKAKLRTGEHCIMLYDTNTQACPFLDHQTNLCGIYQTRPFACVMVEPGDAKCQQARAMKGLPLLKDRNGNEPAREVLEASCELYEMDIEEIYPPPRPICHGFITRDNISYIFEIYSAHDGEPEDFAIYIERPDGSKGQSVDPDPFTTDIQLAYQYHIENESLRD